MGGKLTSLAKYLGRTGYLPGEVGLEIETEAITNYTYVEGLEKYWRTEADGSLRHTGVEYIFRQPYNPNSKDYKAALDLFEQQVKITKFLDSVYTSVHVHLNMNDKSLHHLLNFITLYWLFEEVLTEYCGDYRNGNLFCLKTSNAEAIYRNVQELVRAIENGNGSLFIARLDNNRYKYSGLNIVPLRNLGSVEVRTHPGCTDVRLIDRWVQILYMIYKKAGTFANPVEIINRLFGYKGKQEFFELIFEEYSEFLNLKDLDDKMKNGIWYAASVAGLIDNWKDFGTKKPAKKNTEELLAYYVDDVPNLTRQIDLGQLRRFAAEVTADRAHPTPTNTTTTTQRWFTIGDQ